MQSCGLDTFSLWNVTCIMLDELELTTVTCGPLEAACVVTMRVLRGVAALAHAPIQQQHIIGIIIRGRTIKRTKPATASPAARPTFTVARKKEKKDESVDISASATHLLQSSSSAPL